MYSIINKKFKKSYADGEEIYNLDGFLMITRNRGFVINEQHIMDVKVVNKTLAYPLVSKMVINKYNKLIRLLTELLISDDDSGSSFREALNQIEKFRMEIKIKYRNYLKQKDLEMMSKQLSTLKKEATMRLYDIEDNYIMKDNSNGKSR